MNTRFVFFIVSIIAILTGAAELLSAAISAMMNDHTDLIDLFSFSGLFAVFLFSALAIYLHPRKDNQERYGSRDGFAIVAFGWLAASFVGMFPYMAYGFSLPDAIFESVSGFSTTGASVIEKGMLLRYGTVLQDGIDSLPHGFQFFRCFSNWLGGIGIIVMMIAIVPLLGMDGRTLYEAEVTGIKTPEWKMFPKTASAAKWLVCIYLGLTFLEASALYFIGHMTKFDAVCHAFSTIATGGFSTHQNSIGFYHSPVIEWIIILFMFLSSVNFSLYIWIFKGHRRIFLEDEEFRFYAVATLVSSLIIASFLFAYNASDPYPVAWHDNFRTALFHVTSFFSSTGFTTANYSNWPIFPAIVLFLLSYSGGCGGSTAGGFKCIRVILLWKLVIVEVRRRIFPHLTPGIRLNKTRLDALTIHKVVGFAVSYFGLFMFFAFLLALSCPDIDLETCLSASIASLSNMGPGFGKIGPPECSYAWMRPEAKILLSAEMLFGRLELYTFLVIFLPSFWKK